MTLNEAIMQLVEMRENSMMPIIFKPYLDKVIETISECDEPSDIPHWIPCSERMPDEDCLTGANVQYSVPVLMTAYNAESEKRAAEIVRAIVES